MLNMCGDSGSQITSCACEGVDIAWILRSPWDRLCRKALLKFKNSEQSRQEKLLSKCRHGKLVPVKRLEEHSGSKKHMENIREFAQFFVLQTLEDNNVISGKADISHKYWYLESKYWLAKSNLSQCPESYAIEWSCEPEKFVARIDSFISAESPFVLKRDGGSGGSDINFVQSKEELVNFLVRAQETEEALPFINNRSITNWGLQRFIKPPFLLPKGNQFHKFSLRVYCIVLEDSDWMYSQVEVRLAPEPYTGANLSNVGSHITNGTRNGYRYLSTDFQELEFLKEVMVDFVSSLHRPELAPEITDDVEDLTLDQHRCFSQKLDDVAYSPCAVLAHDIMVDTNRRLYLIETNHSPSAPSPDTLDHKFLSHLDNFVCDMFELLLTEESQSGRFIRV
mmetsp:Transcript_20822/g.25216  ORF Transcript_20822/g.25216 Transcript_20822/m.25216 type:complete len:395 (+) Transcript_20822:230-1414(+)